MPSFMHFIFYLAVIGVKVTSFRVSMTKPQIISFQSLNIITQSSYNSHNIPTRASTTCYMTNQGDKSNTREKEVEVDSENGNGEGEESDVDEEFVDDDSEVFNAATEFSTPSSTNKTVIESDPRLEAIRLKEEAIAAQVRQLETLVNFERNALIKAKDKVSESGKTGFFIVQAQVNDFMRKKEVEQKKSVKANKREFAVKMLPVIDSFRQAPLIAPATTEREQNMHKNFGSLLSGILIVFEKFGFKEYSADIGTPYNPQKHEAIEIRNDPQVSESNGLILEALSSGFIDSDGEILRRAKVIVSKKEQPPVAAAAAAVPVVESETAIDEDEGDAVE